MKKIFATIMVAMTAPAVHAGEYQPEQVPVCAVDVAKQILSTAENGDVPAAQKMLKTCNRSVGLADIDSRSTVTDEVAEVDTDDPFVGYTYIQVMDMGNGQWAIVGLKEL